MSYSILNQLRCCRSRFNFKNGINSTPSQVQSARAFGTSDGNDNGHAIKMDAKPSHKLGQSVILVQQGLEIRELPLIFRKYGENDLSTFCSNELELKPSEQWFYNVKYDDVFKARSFTDTNEIIELLQQCDTSYKVLQLYAAIPEDMIESDVLKNIWERILFLDSGPSLKVHESETTLRDSIFAYQHLMEKICKSCDTVTLLSMLDLLKSALYMNRTIEQIRDEILMRTIDGCLSIMEMCESVHRLVGCEQFNEAEKFWAGFSDAADKINADNIKFVFEILPKLKVSRKMVVGILDKRIAEVFPLLKSDAVTDIMDAIRQCRGSGHTSRTLKAISRWLNVNIHAVDETYLEQILYCMNALNYSDHDIENAIERYMKAKATKIKSQTLIVEIMRHIMQFRLLNSHILNGCSEFFIINSDRIEPGYIRDLICPFGILHFQPLNTSQFWKAIETYLNGNFHKIPSAHIIDIMMATVHLQLFPVNFIDRIFNRNFMHFLHSTTPIRELQSTREKLKLLDIALTLECGDYKGPLLPRRIDGNIIKSEYRIKLLMNDIMDVITSVAGDETSFTKLTIPHQLPICNLYTVDIMFHPAGWLYYNSAKDPNLFVAALIHLPEHYDSTGTYLTGEQETRIRHLRLIGLKVVSLDYTRLRKLSVHRRELREYIVERMKNALPALEPNFEKNQIE